MFEHFEHLEFPAKQKFSQMGSTARFMYNFIKITNNNIPYNSLVYMDD